MKNASSIYFPLLYWLGNNTPTCYKYLTSVIGSELTYYTEKYISVKLFK